MQTLSSRSAFLTRSAAVCTAAMFPICPALAQTARTTLRVATLGGDIGAQVWYAKELGAFDAAGLDVVMMQIHSDDVAAAVAAGSLDIGMHNIPTIAIARSKGIPFSLIAAANLYVANAPTAGLLAVAKTSSVQHAKDLNGKTIGVFGLDGLPEFAVRAWLDRSGGDSASLRFVQMTFPEMLPALMARRVDAVSMDVTADPLLGKPGDGARILGAAFSAVAPVFLSAAWFGTEDWIAQHPDAARRFAQVMRQAAQWGNAHHRESAPIVERNAHLQPGRMNTCTRVTYGTNLIERQIQPCIDVAYPYGELTTSVSAHDMMSSVVVAKR
jgi:NitT/TauT family transport system substrate-binding protein